MTDQALLAIHVETQREQAAIAASALAKLDDRVRAAVLRHEAGPKVDRAIDAYRDRLQSIYDKLKRNAQ